MDKSQPNPLHLTPTTWHEEGVKNLSPPLHFVGERRERGIKSTFNLSYSMTLKNGCKTFSDGAIFMPRCCFSPCESDSQHSMLCILYIVTPHCQYIHHDYCVSLKNSRFQACPGISKSHSEMEVPKEHLC